MTPTKHDAHGRTWAAATGANAGGVSSPIVHPNRPNSQASKYLLAAALRYALNGWPVLPLQPGGKAPLTAHGVKDATTDPETIGAWWQRWPAANIGLALGDDLVTFDVDPRNGGQLDALARWLGVDPSDTVSQRTAGGGWHVIYAKPHGWQLAGAIPNLAGVDVLSGDRYIVASPSTVDGKPYAWQRDPLDVDPARIPLDLAERLRKTSPAARTDAHSGASGPGAGAHGSYDLQDLQAMLAVLDPWQDGYSWWLSMLMACHAGFGDDALPYVEAWADGKPGEVASKWATFDAGGGVTFGTLVYHARLAGWQPVRPEPEEWRITRDDVQACPLCGTFFHTPTADGRTVTVPLTCGNKNCPGERKHRAKTHFSRVLDWDTAYLSVVEDGNPWRKTTRTAKMAGGDWVGITLGGMVLAVTTCPTAGAELVPISEAVQKLTDAIEAMPAGKRIRQPHGMGPRARTRRELTPELRRLRYKIPREDLPVLEDAYRASGIDYAIRRGRLVSCDPLTAEQVQVLGARLATIAETRVGWRCLAQPMRRLRALQVGTYPTVPGDVPIRNGHDPVELSTYRQHGLFLPSEVPIPPP